MLETKSPPAACETRQEKPGKATLPEASGCAADALSQLVCGVRAQSQGVVLWVSDGLARETKPVRHPARNVCRPVCRADVHGPVTSRSRWPNGADQTAGALIPR